MDLSKSTFNRCRKAKTAAVDGKHARSHSSVSGLNEWMMYLDDRPGQVGLVVFYVQSLSPAPLLLLQDLNQFNRYLLLKKDQRGYTDFYHSLFHFSCWEKNGSWTTELLGLKNSKTLDLDVIKMSDVKTSSTPVGTRSNTASKTAAKHQDRLFTVYLDSPGLLLDFLPKCMFFVCLWVICLFFILWRTSG